MSPSKPAEIKPLKSEEPRKLFNMETQHFDREARLKTISKLFGKSTSRSLDSCIDITLNLQKNGHKIPAGVLMDIVGEKDVAKFLRREDHHGN